MMGVELATFNIGRKILIYGFGDKDLDKKVQILRTLDDLFIEYLKMKVYFDKSLITTLRKKSLTCLIRKWLRNRITLSLLV